MGLDDALERYFEEQRGFYESKKENYPFLAEVISGDASYEARLDTLLAKLESLRAALSIKNPVLQSFSDYAAEVCGLLDKRMEDEELRKLEDNALALEGHSVFKKLTQTYTATAGASAVLLLIPPYNVVEAFLLLVGTIGVAIYGSFDEKLAEVSRDKAKAFAPLYEAARSLDFDICRSYALEHFETKRERFEKTYGAMQQRDKSYVKQKLSTLITAGCLEMSANELDRYFDAFDEKNRLNWSP